MPHLAHPVVQIAVVVPVLPGKATGLTETAPKKKKNKKRVSRELPLPVRVRPRAVPQI